MSSEAVRRVLSRLERVRRCRTGWTALCPAHDDRTPSLSVTEGRDGRALVRCFAGCPIEAIVRAISMEQSDLFNDASHRPRAQSRATRNGTSRPSRPRVPPHKGTTYSTAADAVSALERRLGKRVGAWPYLDLAGVPVALVVRFDKPTPAGQRQRKLFQPISRHEDGWRIADPPGLWPLYRLPDLADARRVFICEGEGCVERARSIGLVATTSAGGANRATHTDWSPLAGGDGVILPDQDKAGEGYAKDVAEILLRLSPPAVVRIVRLPEIPEHGDLVDFLELREQVST